MPPRRFRLKDAGQEIPKLDQLVSISDHKLKANRENAKKSTGPKTPGGKGFSRTNSLKHGLFSRRFSDFELLHEDPQEYAELLNDLWAQFQPIGRAEDLRLNSLHFAGGAKSVLGDTRTLPATSEPNLTSASTQG